MKYKKILVLACSLTLLAGVIFGGCSQKATATTDTKTATSSSSGKSTESKASSTEDSADSLFGQITKIDGDSITLTVAKNMNGKGKPSGNGQKPSGDSTEMPQGGPSKDGGSTEQSGSAPDQKQKPSGDSTEQSSEGTSKAGQSGPQMSGETKTITITDSTTIEKESSGSTTQATKDDLKTGTMVSVTMDGDTVKMITMKEMPSGGAGKGQDSSTETSDTTAK